MSTAEQVQAASEPGRGGLAGPGGQPPRQDHRRFADGPRRRPARAGQGLNRRVRRPGRHRLDEGVEGHPGDGQRPDRADRRPDQPAAQRDHAPRGLPAPGGLLARPALLRPPVGDEHDAQDPRDECQQERSVQGYGTGRGVRPERLFKKVYEEEYGTFGGAPMGALVGDYEFTRHPQDMALLEKMSNVAAAAHAPFFTAASAQLFNWDDFTEMSGPRDLSKIFETPEYVKWRSFRDSEDSRYVGLCVPHILMRLPYGVETAPTESFNFEEDVDGTDHRKYLWGNAAYAFACRLTESFAKHNWCAAIRGVEGGGLVQGLPSHTFKTDEGDVALKCPTELAITDRREKELSDLGFIPLCHCKGTDYAAFFAAQSCQKPKVYNTDAANANARLSTQMQYIMAVSRIAHYLKAMMRDKIGSFASRENVEKYLNVWISNYVTTDDTASQEAKAERPLRDARIDVMEVPGKPGAYKAVAFLRPHFQLDELTVSLRLVAELPKAAGSN